MEYDTRYRVNNPKAHSNCSNESNNLNECIINQSVSCDRGTYRHANALAPHTEESRLTQTPHAYHHTENHYDNVCIGGRASAANPRVLEDLSFSRPMAVTTANDTTLPKSLQSSDIDRTQNMSSLEALPASSYDQNRYNMGYDIAEHCSNTNNSASIHISFSDHTSDFKSVERQHMSGQSNVNSPLPPSIQGNACKRIGSRYCLLYTSPSPRDRTRSRMPSSA